MLKFTNVDLKLISDIEKYQFVESMIRDGISMISKDCAGASNIFLKSHGANKPTSFIIYLDAKKLYGHSRRQLFLTKILDWVNSKDFKPI